jgi:outer membrane protein assembly factor BamB
MISTVTAKYEIVFGCYRNDSCVYALNAEDGSLLWKYNTSGAAEGCNDTAPLIYDVDGNGTKEVIVASSCNPVTYCFDGKTGDVLWQAPTRGSDSPPTIADIDGDGQMEILHGEFRGYVICLDAATGAREWELDVKADSTWVQTAPTILDCDSDGNLDFVVSTWWVSNDNQDNRIYAYRGYDQKLLWSRKLEGRVYHGTAAADPDSDVKPEIITGDYSGRLTNFQC